MTLKDKIDTLFRETYEKLLKTPHKKAYTYNIGGNLNACVSDNLKLNSNDIIIGNVYDFTHSKTLYEEIKKIIKDFYPEVHSIVHNVANYPTEDLWEEYSINNKLIISIKWDYGHSYSRIAYKLA